MQTHVLLREMSSRVQPRIVAVAKKIQLFSFNVNEACLFLSASEKISSPLRLEKRKDEPNFLAAAVRVTLQQPIMPFSEQKQSTKSHNRVK